jgi:hypothetical protein
LLVLSGEFQTTWSFMNHFGRLGSTLIAGFLLCCANTQAGGAPTVQEYEHLPLALEKHGEQFVARGQGFSIGVESGKANITIKDRAVSLDFVGSRRTSAVPGTELPGKVNYYLGNDPRGSGRSPCRLTRMWHIGAFTPESIWFITETSSIWNSIWQ